MHRDKSVTLQYFPNFFFDEGTHRSSHQWKVRRAKQCRIIHTGILRIWRI